MPSSADGATRRCWRPIGSYGDRAAIRIAAERFVSDLGGLPGVEAAGLSDVGPLGFCNRYPVEVEGAAGANSDRRASVCEQSVSALAAAVLAVSAGIGVAMALGRFVRSLLYGTRPDDPLTLAMVSAAVLTVAILAAGIPAHRAATVDPAVALRHE